MNQVNTTCQSGSKQKLDAAFKKILSVSKVELQRRIEAEKQKPASHGPVVS
jgi:hypothetical protein